MILFWNNDYGEIMKKPIEETIYLHDRDYYYNIVGKNVKKYRIQAKLTQQQLADMSGVSMHYISQIESGTKGKHYSIEIVGYLADALQISIYKFFEENDN